MRKDPQAGPPFMSKRTAGILMHISSLPSAFGIGDFGPEAFRFADFLKTAKQSWWQILPLNPVGASQQYSPYSSSSAMALNTLFISPEELVREGLIQKADLKNFKLPVTDKVNFSTTVKTRQKLLRVAYNHFRQHGNKTLAARFNTFIQQEEYWLEDFAVYSILKKKFKDKPWYQWTSELKKKNPAAIEKIKNQYQADITEIKWYQFIVLQQWLNLRKYCTGLGVSFIGDLPFYVSHDSADVWANQHVFNLRTDGRMRGVAGVPPDYFKADGQLWGMPVFRWDVLKSESYTWWQHRLKKNAALYDVVRLDHFRAFADYWEVPANEKTARKGAWMKGPGLSFFETIKSTLGALPFIAEDLGDINDEVISLRKKLGLPGMKIAQFAFGGELGSNDYLPHNFTENCIVYTGTHDNNTTKGWFSKDIGKTEKQNLNKYLSFSVNSSNVHELLIRLAYASVARIAVIPMQDVLGLGASARMNKPASVKNNWVWRMPGFSLSREEGMLSTLTQIFNR